MKILLLLGAMALLTASTFQPTVAASTTYGFADNTPGAVKATIARLYPGATGVTFEKEKGDYEANFKLNGKSMSVLLDAKGNVRETETTIAVDQLPAPVRAYVAKVMPGKQIKEAAEIVDAAGKKKYEAEVAGKDLFFSADGQPLH